MQKVYLRSCSIITIFTGLHFSKSQEFSTLAPEANIYKLVGPVLLKQDKNEATMAVNGRLDFIEKEIKRIEGQIKDLQGKNEGKRIALMKLQSEIQQAQHAQQAT